MELHIRDLSKTMKIKILFATLLTLVLFTAGYAQAPDKAKLDQFFDRLAEKNKAMGSLAIAKDGNLLYTRSIGHRRVSGTDRTPSTAATRYRIGSITKMFTAAMTLQLVEEGKLKLTDRLDKFFPQVPNAGRITIAQMLSHRSGIYDLTDAPDFRSWKVQPKTKDEMVAIIVKGKPVFEPGEKEQYSNSGYVLLGYIIEKLTGKSYQEALTERITSKLGLKDTYLGTGTTNPANNEGYSYSLLADWKQQAETDLSIPGGAGAIISTPTDLVKFIQALFDGKIVSKASLASMKPIKDKYGLGIIQFPVGDITVYGHGGGIDGFSALLVYLPEEKLAVAYTSNGTVYPVTDIVGGVLDIYRNRPFTIPAFETFAVKPEVLDKYVGVYASPGVPIKITVTREGDTLLAQLGPNTVALEATAQDKFKFERTGMVFEFDAAKNQMTMTRRGRATVFTKEN